MTDSEQKFAVKLKQQFFSESELEELQRLTFDYFLKETNPENGLVPDSTRQGAPCSIAPTGFAMAAYPVGVERGFIARDDAIKRILTSLRFFWNSPQGPEYSATGYRGFYYHFLDMKTGRRVFNCELSTIDSTYVIAGALTAAEYFNRDTEAEREIRDLAEAIYRRADWQWAQNKALTVTHGWKPKTGFIRYRWTGYSEALILYILLSIAFPSYIQSELNKVWQQVGTPLPGEPLPPQPEEKVSPQQDPPPPSAP